MFKVYAIFDNYKSCYDCPDQMREVYATKELAYSELKRRFSASDIKSGYAYVDEIEVIEGVTE